MVFQDNLLSVVISVDSAATPADELPSAVQAALAEIEDYSLSYDSPGFRQLITHPDNFKHSRWFCYSTRGREFNP